jgi:hypothetical protein
LILAVDSKAVSKASIIPPHLGANWGQYWQCKANTCLGWTPRRNVATLDGQVISNANALPEV